MKTTTSDGLNSLMDFSVMLENVIQNGNGSTQPMIMPMCTKLMKCTELPKLTDTELPKCTELPKSTELSTCTDLPPLNKRKPATRKPVKQGPLVSAFMPPIHATASLLCNWTEQNCCSFSVSKLYREIAHLPKICHKESTSLHGHYSSTTGSNSSMLSSLSLLEHSRLFPTDRKALTRGERNIIEGIYSNRRRNISKQVYVGKTHFQNRRKNYNSGFVKIINDGSVCNMPLIKGKKMCETSVIVEGFSNLRRNYDSPFDDSYSSDDNSSQHTSSISELSNLTSSSNVKYFISDKSNSTNAICQHKHIDTNDKDEVKLKRADDLWNEMHSFSSYALGPKQPSRIEDYSDLELSLGLQALLGTSSNSTRKNKVRDISMKNKSTFNDFSTFSLHSTKALLLRVQNAKQNRQRNQVSFQTSTQEQSEFDIVGPGNSRTSNARKSVDGRDQVDDKVMPGQTSRKVQVRVYLPMAEAETTSEGRASTPSSARKLFLTRERPLSPTEFRERHKGKSSAEVNRIFRDQQSSRTLKEVFLSY